MRKCCIVFAVFVLAVLLCFANAEGRTQQEALSWANARYSEGWQQDYDGINGCQDVDLVKYYYSWLGANPVSGYGYAYVNSTLPTGWTRSSTPQAGDIAVWGANVGVAGQYGHVGIVTNVSGSYFTYVATNDGATKCTRHTVSRYNASIFIHPSFASYAALDINWRIDGADENSAQNAGTCDVYINGARVADDVSDYYAEHMRGSYYEIRDIKAKNGYTYSSVYSGSTSGTLNGNTEVRLSFITSYQPSNGSTVRINSASVPVRSYPSTSATQLGTVSSGQYFAYLGNTFKDSRGVNWYNISYNSQSGWVSSRLTTLSDNPGEYASGDTVYVNGGNTNIRTQPSLTNSKILAVGYKGSTWTYLGKNSVDERGITWYQINYKGTAAWVSSVYTQLIHSENAYDWDDDWSKAKPGIKLVNQSSYLVSNTPTVDGKKAFDGDKSTCWCVRESNYSFGQWVEVQYSSSIEVSGFTICNGYNKVRNGNDYWLLNSRVSNIAVYCDGAYVGIYQLNDTRSAQTVSFSWPVTGSTFKFVIRGAYPGQKYADVCISEIAFY